MHDIAAVCARLGVQGSHGLRAVPGNLLFFSQLA